MIQSIVERNPNSSKKCIMLIIDLTFEFIFILCCLISENDYHFKYTHLLIKKLGLHPTFRFLNLGSNSSIIQLLNFA